MLRAAVIGVGNFGQNHARVWAELEGVSLVAVADIIPERAERVGRRFRTRAYTDYWELLLRERPDIVSIAVPTSQHRQVAVDAASAGVHVLLEKPMASSSEEARAIIEAAERHSVRLAIGHIERFNPAVLELKRRLDEGQLGRIFQLSARRLGPLPDHIAVVGVLMDLATHELNLSEFLLGSPIVSLYAEVERHLHPSHEDMLSSVIHFANSVTGLLDINWLTPAKIRELAILGERGLFRLNYLTQELYFHENTEAVVSYEGMVSFLGVGIGQMIRYEIPWREPLKAELADFAEAVAKGLPVAVNGAAGLRAVYLAEQLLVSGACHRVIRL